MERDLEGEKKLEQSGELKAISRKRGQDEKRATELGRKTREEIGNGKEMTALRFRTRG